MFSAFNPSKCTHLEQWAADCAAPGEQSWNSCRSRDSNPQPWVTSGFKSNALSIRPTIAQDVRRVLTEHGERDPKDKHHHSSTQGQQEVADSQNTHNEQAGVPLLEVLDQRFILSGPHRAHEDQSHNRPANKHAQRVHKAANTPDTSIKHRYSYYN